jgi:glycosyltransferase involved in cell wall biosynthesis
MESSSSQPVPLSLPLTLSLIIPVYQGGKIFQRCLAGIADLVPAASEIIVVVDGEDDGSGEMALAIGAKVLRLGQRFGPAKARNSGAWASTGELLLFIDADTVPTPTLVDQVRGAFAADPGLAALIGSYDDAPGADTFLSQYRNLLHHYTHQTANTRALTFWGACGAVRREAFASVGGFDEHYEIPAMEDVELGYRLSRAGHRIELHKAIQVKHLKRWDALNLLHTDIFQRALPWSRLLLREERIHNDLNLRTDSRFSAGLAWVLLAALAALPLWPEALYAVAATILALLGLNAPLYRFFQNKKGWLFMLATLPWHWFYFLYSSAAFAYVLLVEGRPKPN